jgi:hypothetical protein
MWAVIHATGHYNRFRHCQVDFSAPRRWSDGNVILRDRLKRRRVLAFFQKLPPCLIGIEARAS